MLHSINTDEPISRLTAGPGARSSAEGELGEQLGTAYLQAA
jgi:hypothetical protein